jgi:hypothetical protein
MITTRNLIYHLAPFDNNDTWLKNLAQLRRRWVLFNGQRIISVATGGGMVPLDRIKPFLPDPEIEWLQFSNCRSMREAASFYPMMDRLSSSPDEATFYAHAKGVTHNPCDVGIRDWRNQMYHHCLDRAEECMKLLQSYPCVGSYRQRHWPGTMRKMSHLAPELRNQEWHYAGTFWWFRNKDVFSHPGWHEVPMSGYAVEFFMPWLFKHEQAYCLYRDNPTDPYKRPHEHMPDPCDWPSAFLEGAHAPVGG